MILFVVTETYIPNPTMTESGSKGSIVVILTEMMSGSLFRHIRLFFGIAVSILQVVSFRHPRVFKETEMREVLAVVVIICGNDEGIFRIFSGLHDNTSVRSKHKRLHLPCISRVRYSIAKNVSLEKAFRILLNH
jgi:hypothetical protein